MSPPHGVRISARAERDLVRLPAKIGAARLEFVFDPLAEDPYRLGGALRGPLEGLQSARRGSYRVIYRVDDDQRNIEVIHLDRRRAMYR